MDIAVTVVESGRLRLNGYLTTPELGIPHLALGGRYESITDAVLGSNWAWATP